MITIRKLLATTALLGSLGSAHAGLPLCSVSSASWLDAAGTSETNDGNLSVFGWHSGAAAYSFTLETKIDGEAKWTDAGIAQGHDIDGNKSRWGLSRTTYNLTAGTHTVQVRAVDLTTRASRLCGSITFKVELPPTGECVTAINTTHMAAGRAFTLFSNYYAKGSNDALGLAGVITSLERTSTTSWRKVPSCQ